MNLTAMVLLGAAVGVGQAPAGPANPLAEYQPLQKRTLTIPIDYDPKLVKKLRATQLIVSDDEGQTWLSVSTVTPDRPALDFAVNKDGKYWVSSVQVFLDGQRWPPDPTRPPPESIQKLLIDTTPPVVRFTTLRRDGDDVVAEWTVEDQFPDDAATQMVFKPAAAPDAAFQPVPPGSVNGPRRMARFKPGTADELVVKIQVQDLCRNLAEYAGKVAPAAAERTAGFLAPPSALPAPLSAAVPPPPVVPPPTDGLIPPSLPGLPVAGPAPVAAAPLLPVAPAPPAAPAPLPSSPAPVAVAPLSPVPTLGGNPNWAPVGAADPGRPTPLATAGQSPPAADPEPAGVGPQIFNTSRFPLNYQADSGSSGIHHIDLYVTRDDGQSWTRWSQHPGRETPLKVVLDTPFNAQREGDYGLRLVPVSGAGLSAGPPAPGTPPEFRLHVDTTPPVLKLFEPRPDPAQRNAVTLNWSATDRNFGREPISIEWSDRPAGPWRPVTGSDGVVAAAAGQPAPAGRVANTGTYSWVVPAGLNTPKVYFRFTAWDAAGNRSEAVTRDPQLIDMTMPKATIQGIGPVAGRP